MKALLVAVLLLSLGLAATASAPARHPAVRPLVSSPRPIYAFAQDGDRMAWVAADGRVRLRSLSTRRTWVVGTVPTRDRASSALLALAGNRVLWSFDAGGNSTEFPVVVGAPGRKPVEIAHLGGGLRGMGDGHDLVGVSGDGTTLAYGWVAETCPGQPYGCNTFEGPLVVAGGGVSPATWAPAPRAVLPGGRPGRSSAGALRDHAGPGGRRARPRDHALGQWVPRVVEDGSVEVYDLAGGLQLRAPFLGLVRDVALSGRSLAVLPGTARRRQGRRALRSSPKKEFVEGARVPLAAADLAVGRRRHDLPSRP